MSSRLWPDCLGNEAIHARRSRRDQTRHVVHTHLGARHVLGAQAERLALRVDRGFCRAHPDRHRRLPCAEQPPRTCPCPANSRNPERTVIGRQPYRHASNLGTRIVTPACNTVFTIPVAHDVIGGVALFVRLPVHAIAVDCSLRVS